MLLTLTSTGEVPSDLGHLLHKHPDRAQSFDLPVGTAHVFYPEVTARRCTVALLLEVDPVGLVRGRGGGEGFALAQYVNDRPYAASSLLAVALGRVFRTALTGRCTARPDLEGAALPLEIRLPSVPSTGGADLVHRLLGPLGWTVRTDVQPLDPTVPAWGASRYLDVQLTGTMPLARALSHLYVLLPVLDGDKHYWVSGAEVDKLVRSAGDWLADHPERALITTRYLAHQGGYVADATARLDALGVADGEPPATPVYQDEDPPDDRAVQPQESLVAARHRAVLAALRAAGAARVVDLGCGEGALLRELLADVAFTEVVGVDVSPRALERAGRRLGLERLPDQQRARLTLRQSSLTYRDARLAGYDAAVLMEVVEHVDPERLPDLARAVFGAARPRVVLVTTPNAEYNARYERLAPGALRHPDHRFEWTRQEFTAWCDAVSADFGYTTRWEPVGEVDPRLGPATQMAVFQRLEAPA